MHYLTAPTNTMNRRWSDSAPPEIARVVYPPLVYLGTGGAGVSETDHPTRRCTDRCEHTRDMFGQRKEA